MSSAGDKRLSPLATRLLAEGLLDGSSEQVDVDYYAQALDVPTESLHKALRELAGTGALVESTVWLCPHCANANAVDDARCGVCGDTRQAGSSEVVLFLRRSVEQGRDPAAVFLIHGMNTLGAWQESLSWRLQLIYGRSIPVFVFKYGHDLTSPFLRTTQARRMRQLGSAVERAMSDLRSAGRATACDIIAHSFGTLLLARLLTTDEFRHLAFGKVILTGCIAPRRQPWSQLIAAGRVEGVLNHRGGRDYWVRFAPWVFPSTGSSGAHGFEDNESVEDHLSPDFRHSDYFSDKNFDTVIRQFWSPFLTTNSELPNDEGRVIVEANDYRFLLGRLVVMSLVVVTSYAIWGVLRFLCSLFA